MKYRFSQEIEVQVKYIGFVKNKSLTKKKYRFSQELEV
jgi:predicted glycosyltransferase